MFSSDNGPEDYRVSNAANAGVGNPGPLRARKRSMHEGGVRTFGLVRWPGKVPAGRVEDGAVVGAVDFLPTIASLAGVQVPASLAPDGEDLSGLWRGEPAVPRRKPLHWEWLSGVQGQEDGYMPPPLCVRDGDWKLFVNHHGQGAQLFNIPRDPGEQQDLAGENPDVVEKLTGKALAWMKTLPPSPARDKLMTGVPPAGKSSAKAESKPKASLDRPRIFEAWDKDNDGFLTKDEFIPHISDKADAPERFCRFDRDKDGRISKEEFARAGQ